VLANWSFNVNKLMQQLKTEHESLDCGAEFFRRAEIVKKLYLIFVNLTSKKMLPLELHT
jgi:hypothetical protein